MGVHDRLIEAAQQGELEVAQEALDSGVDPDTRDEFGQTALIWAIMNGNSEVALALLNAGADPNLKGSMLPPLASASSQGHLVIVERLLALGAEIDSNAKIFAQVNEHVEVLVKLTEVEAAKEAGTWEPAEPSDWPTIEVPGIVAYAARGDVSAVQSVIDAGGDLDECGQDGSAPRIRRTPIEQAQQAASYSECTPAVRDRARSEPR